MESVNLATVQQAKDMGLLESEFEKIKEILGRTPNFCELSIYGVMWSEHCSYKNSILWLKKLPNDGPHMLVKAGEENAGLVDIGDGLACCLIIIHQLSSLIKVLLQELVVSIEISSLWELDLLLN